MTDSMTVLVVLGVLVIIGAVLIAQFAKPRHRDDSRPLFTAFFFGGLALGTFVGWLFGGAEEGAGIGLLAGALAGAYYPSRLDRSVRSSPSSD